MTTQLSTKLTALGAALMLNALMIGGIAFLFNVQAAEAATPTTVVSLAMV